VLSQPPHGSEATGMRAVCQPTVPIAALSPLIFG
jgi:poly-beta-hydroxyalkanoate depolymerase